jgi:hypothetical protein
VRRKEKDCKSVVEYKIIKETNLSFRKMGYNPIIRSEKWVR